ncbi:MAG: cation:proton antiporter [Verrucomicrobiales bacterium]
MQESIFVRDLAIVLIVATGVGWAAQRIGLSAVVGYLLAGAAIGPFSPLVKIVSNTDHIQLLSQIGLVFLMFAIGLGLSFARLKRMGFSILGAAVISAILLFNLCRWFGSALGWSPIQIVFLAGTLMISSSAIIIKVLDELNITHQRAGQLALGITVLEDIVAVVMLTLFISMVQVGSNESASMWNVLGSLSAFVVFLVVIAMLFVPRLLQLLSSDPSSELRIIAVTGLVLLAAVSAYQAGYSFALGAFVMGVVVAGTRYKDELESAFSSLHTIFGAVFFVAVGMMFDYKLLASVWWLVLLVTALTVIGRPLACATGLMAVGHSSKNSLQAGIALIPIGEFAFVMIQVGKSANVLPESFYALGIGVSLATAIIGPLLTRRSESIASWIESREPKPFRDVLGAYHRWLEAFQVKTSASVLWRLTSKRVLQTGFHLLFMSALILFSKPVFQLAMSRFGGDIPLFGAFYWGTFGVIILAPLIILWRNMEALAMILAEGATLQSDKTAAFRPLLQAGLKTVAAIVLGGWLLLLIPVGPMAIWTLGLAAVIILLAAPWFWKRLVATHAKIEFDLRQRMKAASTLGSSTGLPPSVLEQPQRWNLQIDEVTLPLGSDHAGRCISELGIRKNLRCSIMTIDRQGYLITNPAAEDKLFSGDKLLLLGAPEQLSQAEQFLRGVGGVARSDALADITMETVQVPQGSSVMGQTLQEANLATRFHVQICGIERNGSRLLTLSSSEKFLSGDTLLLLGAHENIQRLGNFLSGL